MHLCLAFRCALGCEGIVSKRLVLVDDRAVAIEMLVEDDVAMSAVQELGSAGWSNWNKTARRA
jgi:hypothetical protein